MQIYIAGSGKLATELIERLEPIDGLSISSWANAADRTEKSIVVHAGSGRELEAISRFCTATSSVLIELSTGSSLENGPTHFPIVVCPNTNILMLKFMYMLERSGAMFAAYDTHITESHQASKTSVPGTAVQMANALGVNVHNVVSIRDSAIQQKELNIPQTYMGRHAFHRIHIQDGPCSIAMETRVFGEAPYASGVQQIIGAVRVLSLESRVYSIIEFIARGWI